MRLFLDTEFTDFGAGGKLLSIALVNDTGGSPEFYAEVTDRDRLAAASDFVECEVISRFGQVPGAACSYVELCARLADFMDDMVAKLAPDEFIEICFDYHQDCDFMELALWDAGVVLPGRQDQARRRRDKVELRESRMTPVNVFDITGADCGEAAANRYFDDLATPLGRHHALCDARALLISYQAEVAGRAAFG